MLRLGCLLPALALAACGSSAPDLCTQAVSASQRVANELDACAFGDAGSTSAETASAIASCKTSLSSCTAADQGALGTQATCLADLTSFSCSWFSEETMGIVDAGLSQWVGEVAACKPSSGLSARCPGLGDLVPAPCGESVCAPPLTCQNTAACGQSCVCARDADCPSDQRCGPTSGCGMACFHLPPL